MKKYTLVACLLLMSGCANFNFDHMIQERVDRIVQDKIDRSIEKNVSRAGFFWVDNLRNDNYENVLNKTKEIYSNIAKDIAYEDKIFLELSYLQEANIDLDREVDLLVSKNQSEPFAHLIRGAYFQGKASRARGSRWIGETSESQINEMIKLQKVSLDEYQKTLELDKENFVAYLQIGEIYSSRKNTEELSQKYYKKALEIRPESYWVWAEIILKSEPRWGGSHELMQAKIDEMKKYIKYNAKLSSLQNYVLFDKAEMAENGKNFDLAEKLYQEALVYGRDHKVISHMGYIDKVRGKYAEGCQLIREAIKQRPYSRWYNTQMVHCEDIGY